MRRGGDGGGGGQGGQGGGECGGEICPVHLSSSDVQGTNLLVYTLIYPWSGARGPRGFDLAE